MIYGRIKDVVRSFGKLFRGEREITFYFQTVKFSDALLALWYSFARLIGLPLAKNGRKEFLREVNRTFDFQSAYLFGSARSGLYSLLKALAFEDGAEVIVTGFTCDVVPNAVIQAGCKPVYADIDSETFCMSPSSAAQCITEKTRAIIIQHTFGIPADIEPLMKLAEEHSLYVIEDCAVSLGSRYQGQLTGTFGDAAIFSFELSKTITSCRGGLLIINTNKHQAITKLKKFYQSVPEQSKRYAGNILFQLGLSGLLYRPIIYNLGKYIIAVMFKTGIFKMSTSDSEKEAKITDNYLIKLSNQQASLLSRQWKRLKKIKNKSQEATKYFYESLKNIPSIIPFPIRNDMSLNLIRYPLIIENRQGLLEVFREHNVELGLWFTAPISSPRTNHAIFGYVSGTCPEAEKVSKKICNLPVHYRLNADDLNKIIVLLCERRSV